MRRSTELVTTSLPDEDKPARLRSKSAPPAVTTPTTSTNTSTRQPRLSLLRRLSNRFFKKKSRKKEAPTVTADEQEQSPRGVVTSPSKKKPTTPLDDVLAERDRIDAIRELIIAEDFDTALAALLSDTDEDLHYFNKVKADVLGDAHLDTFSNKHGRLLDYEDRPPPIEKCRMCLWCGTNDFGHALRCHNQSIHHPIERVTDQLGVDHPKPMEFCAYHVKYCVNTTKHDVPVRIRIPNEDSLCNECYILQNNKPPKCLVRIPGTRRKRS